MVLAAFDPNLIAHCSLVTTDGAAAAFNLLTLYLFWEYVTRPSIGRLLATGFSLGLALSSKYSMIALPIVLCCVAVTLRLSGSQLLLPGAQRHQLGWKWGWVELFGVLLVVGYTATLVLWAAYFFQDPYHYEVGLRHVLDHNDRGHPAYFCGEYSQTGWPLYFPLAFLIKTPIGTLFCIAASLILFPFGARFKRSEAIFVLLPLCLYAGAATQAQINIGLRHILHLYLPCYVVAGRLATVRLQRFPVGSLLCAIAVVVTLSSSVRNLPHHIAYFNGFVGGPAGGSQYLSDSNLDWGQDLKNLARYLQEQDAAFVYLAYFGDAPPEYYGIRYQHLPCFGPILPPQDDPNEGACKELLAISMYTIHGVWLSDHDRYRWVEEYHPVTTIGNSIRVYDITTDVDVHRRLADIYRQHGLKDFALAEDQKVRLIGD